jgi:hypothetical protein
VSGSASSTAVFPGRLRRRPSLSSRPLVPAHRTGGFAAFLCSAHGAELLGEEAQYESIFRLCYLRGPAGIIVALAEQIG